MPLVRIDLAKGTSAQFRKTLGDIVYKAMIDIIDVPKDDKFQIITEHPPEELNYAPSYLGIEHSSGLVLIQVTMSVGRTVQAKQAFYRQIAEQLHAQLGVRGCVHKPGGDSEGKLVVRQRHCAVRRGLRAYGSLS
jgi:4-oxalocrotonate tautomerase